MKGFLINLNNKKRSEKGRKKERDRDITVHYIDEEEWVYIGFFIF
jgi:hypothetical protein